MNTIDKLMTLNHLQHIAEIHVESLEIDIRSHIVWDAVVVVLLVDVEQLLVFSRNDDEVVLIELSIELLVEIIECKHIDRHRRIEQFQSVAVHLTILLHFCHTLVNLLDESRFCIRQFHLADISQRFPIVCFRIIVATLEIPVTLRTEERVKFCFHKPHTLGGIHITLQQTEFLIGHVRDVHVEINLVRQLFLSHQE